MLGAKRKLVVLVLLSLSMLLMWRASAILAFGIGMLIGTVRGGSAGQPSWNLGMDRMLQMPAGSLGLG